MVLPRDRAVHAKVQAADHGNEGRQGPARPERWFEAHGIHAPNGSDGQYVLPDNTGSQTSYCCWQLAPTSASHPFGQALSSDHTRLGGYSRLLPSQFRRANRAPSCAGCSDARAVGWVTGATPGARICPPPNPTKIPHGTRISITLSCSRSLLVVWRGSDRRRQGVCRMASLPLILTIGGAFCALAAALWVARRTQFGRSGGRNRPAQREVSFATDGEGAPAARSGRRMLAPERASVTRRRGRQHAVPTPL